MGTNINPNFDVNYVNKYNKNTGTREYPWNIAKKSLEEKKNHMNNRHKNLETIKNIFDKFNIKWCLIGGTLLGAVRDNELILNDYDDDIWVFNPISNEVIDELINNKFKICRYEGRYVLSIIRYGAPIDFCFKNNIYGSIYSTLEPRLNVFNTSMKFYENMKTINLRNINYPIPNYVERYLNFLYYSTWKTPISNGQSRGQSNDPFIIFTKEEEDEVDLNLYNNIKCAEGKINIFFI